MAIEAISTKRQIAIDANLLLLLVVGNWNPRFIAQHKRLSGYSVQDYAIVREFVASFHNIATTAHVLTEVSNLAAFVTGEAKAAIYRQLAQTIVALDERHIPSAAASTKAEFNIFGLTDAALSLVAAEMPLLTEDRPLAAHLQRRGFQVWTLQNLKQFRDWAASGQRP